MSRLGFGAFLAPHHPISGGFGTVVGFVHDWANPENTMRSWDMVARDVVPEINGYLAGLERLANSSPTTASISTALAMP